MTEQGHQVASDRRGKIRAGDADRDRVAGILGTAYTEGRLSKDEYDARLDSAMSARTFADLDQVLTDLPAGRATPPRAAVVPAAGAGAVTPVAATNSMAIASFACGLSQFVFGPLGTIPAIVFGHMARSQIRRTGEQGAGLALAGLILGWGAVLLGVIIAVIAVLAVAAGSRNGMPMNMG
jgi:DUF1707 SHOCT-like domain/Domain of unknown function (DUF4190)